MKNIATLLLLTLTLTTCAKEAPSRSNNPVSPSVPQAESPQKPKQPASPTIEKPQVEHPPLHPAFSINREDLMMLIRELPQEVQHKIIDSPSAFLADIEHIIPLYRKDPMLFKLIDKKHALPSDYVPQDLTELSAQGIKISKQELYLRKIIIDDLKKMIEDAKKEDNVELIPASCYRSYATQKRIYQWEVDTYGQEQADRESARPGTSQHQSGLAIDFYPIDSKMAQLPTGKWLAENAYRYGFSLSYPEEQEALTGYMYEPWHYRYITPAGTQLEKKYFIYQQYLLEFLDKHMGEILKKYKK
ncbi:M15 family metallopeptidase [Spirochaetia bacterium 38H-sp]|uniref:M15 family metallopeptidase n=1 Tax=Rarispira pelagica TaxID=3141764 RepID=A0ABU9UCS5_9SPIR